MPSGFQDIRSFLKLPVEEKGSPDIWFIINTKATNFLFVQNKFDD